MQLRLFIFIGLLILLSDVSKAQDFSGIWKGHYTYLNVPYDLEFTIFQDGKVITGTGATKHKKDSAKYYFNGALDGHSAELTSTSFIYKKGLYCLSKFKLNLNGEELNGSFGGNAVWGGCLPIVAGSVSLKRVQTEGKIDRINLPAKQKVLVDDFEGTELIRELKKRKYYALIIATNNYPDPNIPMLSKPIADAKLLKETLQEHYTFADENINFLQNPTRSALIEAFDKLSKEITNRDNLLIFYAGHGIWDERLKQGFWLPTDATRDSKAQWLSNGTIRDFVRAIDSKHTLLITDACFGGSILKERAVFFNGKAMLEMYKRPSRKAMTSGALSTVPDESVFIKYLVENLRSNPSPLMSAEQVFGDFKVAVINNSETGQVPQYGAISMAGDQGGDFIFLRKDALE